jgi:predicted DCC family thiol-disulfide oxidoreductase YuxK
MKTLAIFYDNHCPNCTRFSKVVKKLDWLKKIEIKQLRSKLDTNSYPEINLQLASKQMASFNSSWHYGYDSIFFTLIKLPLFWITIPFLYILKITRLGQLMYSELALKRKIIPLHCDVDICNI